jgi:hypothetical protein
MNRAPAPILSLRLFQRPMQHSIDAEVEPHYSQLTEVVKYSDYFFRESGIKLASFLIDRDSPKINVGRQAVPVVERVGIVRFVTQLVAPRR